MNQMKKLLLAFLLPAAAPAQAGEAAALIEQCNEAHRTGHYEQAVGHAEAALRLQASADAWLCLGRAQGGLGRHEAALQALNRAEQASATPLQRMVALTLLGDQHAAAGSHEVARSHYQSSLEAARQAGNRRFQAINLNRIGDALAAAKDHTAALTQYRQGLDLAGNDNERAKSHARIAAAHHALAGHDLAIEHQIKAVLLQERMGSLADYAEAMLALVRYCLAGRAYRDAERWLGRLIPVTTLNEAPYWEARARALMAETQAALGNAEAAAAELAQARALAEKAGDQEFLQQFDRQNGQAGTR